ncbi:unnamed protein product [Rotaria magnacalcarata]|uniref:Ankyrin repeat domain-containing protein 40 n=1 Tax=Rotaria magnacalcarata TaxID=392030 RepID=A0A819X299_9BILA|nr:unnamed protein product [Rotaria magnacalcarata]CAF4134076.1 unnamed protein product [Rotaria magnacalcarata]
MNFEKLDEELLRELASKGDIHQIQTLLSNKPNLNVNSQNAMNGWTALHWAAKRNHTQVVEYLLEKGANKDIQTNDKLTPAHVCNNESLRKILESNTSDNNASYESIANATLPIIPNYLRHPVFPYISSEPRSNLPNLLANDTQTITLLCRIADDPSETDYVEFEFNKSPIIGSFERLQSNICHELDIDRIDKLRRLPCVRVRNDRDVERLKDNHMLEVILIKQ